MSGYDGDYYYAFIALPIVLYIIVSWILCRFPGIIWTPKQANAPIGAGGVPLGFHDLVRKYCRAGAHRGGACESPENTLTAYRHAKSNQMQLLELDVHLSRDGKVVVVHDPIVQGVAVKDVPYDEIPALPKEMPISVFDFEETKVFSRGDNVPLLEQVFEEFDNLFINIDLKPRHREDAEPLAIKVLELIRKFKRENRTFWGSFLEPTTKYLYEIAPDIPVYASAKRSMVIYAAYFFGLLPFLSLKESMFVVPSPYLLDKFYSAKISPSLNSRFKRFLVFCLLKFCKFLMSREGLYKHLSKRGIGTIFWVVQNDCEFQQSFALGAQGVMTDYPSRLSRFLSSSKEDRDSKSHLD